MSIHGPQPLIDLGDVSTGGNPPIAALPPRRTNRRAGVMLVVVLCAATMAGSVVPRSHGPRLSWSMALDPAQGFTLTPGALIVHPGHGGGDAGNAGDRLAAYDAVDGSPLWSAPVSGEEFHGAWPAHDVLLMPVEDDAGRGVVGSDRAFTTSTVAVDVATGARRWRIAGNVAMAVNGLGVVDQPDDVTGRPATLRAIRLTDGQTVWSRSSAGGLSWA